MGSDFQSFNASALGGFSQSPLLARGGGAGAGNNLPALTLVVGNIDDFFDGSTTQSWKGAAYNHTDMQWQRLTSSPQSLLAADGQYCYQLRDLAAADQTWRDHAYYNGKVLFLSWATAVASDQRCGALQLNLSGHWDFLNTVTLGHTAAAPAGPTYRVVLGQINSDLLTTSDFVTQPDTAEIIALQCIEAHGDYLVVGGAKPVTFVPMYAVWDGSAWTYYEKPKQATFAAMLPYVLHSASDGTLYVGTDGGDVGSGSASPIKTFDPADGTLSDIGPGFSTQAGNSNCRLLVYDNGNLYTNFSGGISGITGHLAQVNGSTSYTDVDTLDTFNVGTFQYGIQWTRTADGLLFVFARYTGGTDNEKTIGGDDVYGPFLLSGGALVKYKSGYVERDGFNARECSSVLDLTQLIRT